MDSSPVSTSPPAATADLAKAAFHCEPLTRARRLAHWVGGHRTLTSSGVLRPADARQACQDLGIELGGRRFRSALDLDELMRDWVIAEAAEFLWVGRTQARGLSPEDLASPDSDPERTLDAWVAAATGQLELADDEQCLACLVALHELYTAPEPITLEQLGSAVVAAVVVAEPEDIPDAPCPGCGEIHEPGPDLLGLPSGDDWYDPDSDETLADHVAVTIAEMLAFNVADIVDEKLRLTPLGGFLADQIFQGLEIPPDADVSTVMSVVGATSLEIGRVLFQSWLGARSASAAVNELLAFAESATGVARVGALAIAGEVGGEAVDTFLEWAGRPGFGAYARLWLLEHDEPVVQDPADEAWIITDELDCLLESLTDSVPPEELHEAVFDQVDGDMAEVAKLVLGSGHPKADYVATWLTDHQETAPDPTIFQLKITLLKVSKPPVWRRVLVPASTTLFGLHRVIQQVMGWEDDHLHVFAIGRQLYGSPDGGLGYVDDSRVRLSAVVVGSGDKFRYTYDFGDDWEHEIVVEKVLVAGLDETYPSCVQGKGTCPPEDCGGVWAYANIKEIVADPSHDEHQNALEWLGLDSGEDFDANEFSVAEVNTRLRRRLDRCRGQHLGFLGDRLLDCASTGGRRGPT